ncbi:MAG: hypothetical protein ACJ8AW_35835 [Rhodopila sp.]
MLTIVTAAPEAVVPPSPPSTPDPCHLDRWADVLVSQGYARQGERLAHQAADLRDCRP